MSVTTQECDDATAPYYSFYYLLSCHLLEVKNKTNSVKFLPLKVVAGAYDREVVAYKRFQI